MNFVKAAMSFVRNKAFCQIEGAFKSNLWAFIATQPTVTATISALQIG